jgi:hypothetical protein
MSLSEDPDHKSDKSTGANLDKWLYAPKKEFREYAADTDRKLAAKDKVIADLTERIAKLEKAGHQASSKSLSYSETLASQLAKPNSAATIAIIKAVSANAKTAETKAKKVVFAGVPASKK